MQLDEGLEKDMHKQKAKSKVVIIILPKTHLSASNPPN